MRPRRSAAIAVYFGASRGLDIYFIAYAVANWVGFALATSLDSVAVIHFVRAREGDQRAQLRRHFDDHVG